MVQNKRNILNVKRKRVAVGFWMVDAIVWQPVQSMAEASQSHFCRDGPAND
jgi:hypothetical protein